MPAILCAARHDKQTIGQYICWAAAQQMHIFNLRWIEFHGRAFQPTNVTYSPYSYRVLPSGCSNEQFFVFFFKLPFIHTNQTKF